MTGIEMNVKDYAELDTLVASATAFFGKRTPLLKAWAVVLQQDNNRRFAEGGSPDTWKPLALSTKAARRQGKGAITSALPLQGLRSTFDVVIKGQHGHARYQLADCALPSRGTKGPYEITPKKPGGVLALPYFPPQDGQRVVPRARARRGARHCLVLARVGGILRARSCPDRARRVRAR